MKDRPRSSIRPFHSQPALFVTSVAVLAAVNEKFNDAVENCGYAAGLSLGEYTALFFAGVIDFEDGVRVVAERGAAMQAAADTAPSGMVSILGLERDRVEQLCRESAQGADFASGELALPRQHRRLGNKDRV